MFGIGVSPFLVGYLILLGYLMINGPSSHAAHLVWFTSLIVIAMLFLWIPAPLYWLIWITPFMIGVLDKSPKLLLSWIMLQVAFGCLLIFQHRDLGVGLPIQFASIFRIPNLATALAVTHPTLFRAAAVLLPVLHGIQVIALLVLIWYSSKALFQPAGPVKYDYKLRGWIGLPTAILLLGLTTNIFFSRNLVSHDNSFGWQNQTITAGDTLLQKLGFENREITGVKLRFTEASTSANSSCACTVPMLE